MNELEKQAREYFGQEGFQRVFKGFANNYISFDRIGGKITLTKLSKEEQDALEGFLQKDCHHSKSIVITADAFRKAIRKTKFAELSFEDVFSLIFTEKLLSKKQQKLLEKEKWEESFDAIREGIPEGKAKTWFLRQELELTSVFYKMKQEEKANAPRFIRNLRLVLEALDHLPVYQNQYMNLPVFAAKITGEPHAFDDKSSMSYYLLKGICDICRLENATDNAENRKEILYRAGIVTDGISNFTICTGIRGFLQDGSEHPGMKGFCDRHEEVQVNLNLLSRLKTVKAVSYIVYVVENPAVFEAMQEVSAGKYAIVCGYGQPRLATLFLLDRLVESEHELFYCGDFDPEGLMIAQRLSDRWKDSFHFWHYEKADYELAKSAQEISKDRLVQCQKLTHPKLIEMAKNLEKDMRAGYQENLLEYYLADIQDTAEMQSEIKNRSEVGYRYPQK